MHGIAVQFTARTKRAMQYPNPLTDPVLTSAKESAFHPTALQLCTRRAGPEAEAGRGERSEVPRGAAPRGADHRRPGPGVPEAAERSLFIRS